MNPSKLLLSLVALVLAAAPLRAQSGEPQNEPISKAKVESLFGYKLPEGAQLGAELWTVDEFWNETLFGAGAKQCVAASTPVSAPKELEDGPGGWKEFTSEAFVLARSAPGSNSFQAYRFWVAGSARGKKAKAVAKGKLKIFQDKLTRAIETSPRCP